MGTRVVQNQRCLETYGPARKSTTCFLLWAWAFATTETKNQSGLFWIVLDCFGSFRVVFGSLQFSDPLSNSLGLFSDRFWPNPGQSYVYRGSINWHGPRATSIATHPCQASRSPMQPCGTLRSLIKPHQTLWSPMVQWNPMKTYGTPLEPDLLEEKTA